MENLPLIFKAATLGSCLFLFLTVILLWFFESKRWRTHKLMVRERLDWFVRYPMAAITSYFEGCDFETWLKVRPDMWIDYYVDTSRKLSGDGLSMATAFKDPKEAYVKLVDMNLNEGFKRQLINSFWPDKTTTKGGK